MLEVILPNKYFSLLFSVSWGQIFFPQLIFSNSYVCDGYIQKKTQAYSLSSHGKRNREKFHIVDLLSSFLKPCCKGVASEYLYEFFGHLRGVLKSCLDNIAKETKQVTIEQVLFMKLFSFSLFRNLSTRIFQRWKNVGRYPILLETGKKGSLGCPQHFHEYLWFECEISPMGSHLNTWSLDGYTFLARCLKRWSFAGRSVLPGVGFDAVYAALVPVHSTLPKYGYNVTSQPPATAPQCTLAFLPNRDGLYPTRIISQNKPTLLSFALIKVFITAIEKQVKHCLYSSNLWNRRVTWEQPTPSPHTSTLRWSWSDSVKRADKDLQLWGDNKGLPLRWQVETWKRLSCVWEERVSH